MSVASFELFSFSENRIVIGPKVDKICAKYMKIIHSNSKICKTFIAFIYKHLGDGKKTALIQTISYYVSIFVIFNLLIKNNKT